METSAVLERAWDAAVGRVDVPVPRNSSTDTREGPVNGDGRVGLGERGKRSEYGGGFGDMGVGGWK